MRTPDGRRGRSSPATFVCFPSGAEGAHDVTGPGRVLMLSSGGRAVDLGLSRVSDKLGHALGRRGRHALTSAAPTRSTTGRARSDRSTSSRSSSRYDDGDPDGYHTAYARVGPLVGGERLGLSVYELPPGQSICPYHYEAGDEEWLVVLTGRPRCAPRPVSASSSPGTPCASRPAPTARTR